MTRAEAYERIEHIQRLGRREGVFTKYWFKDGGSSETFRGYDLETAWVEPDKRKRIEDANSLYLSLSWEFRGPDEQWPAPLDVTGLSDEQFVRFVRSLPDRLPVIQERSTWDFW